MDNADCRAYHKVFDIVLVHLLCQDKLKTLTNEGKTRFCVNYILLKLTSKNPITTTSSFSLIAEAASKSSIVIAGGPVFFFSQSTISVVVRPPVNEKNMLL